MDTKTKYRCKVGTIPSMIIFKENYEIKEGQSIVFQFIQDIGSPRWIDGEIWKVNNDRYFFVKYR